MAGLGTRHGLAKEIGLAICPKAAVFNHSCAANAFARVRLRPGRAPCVEVRAIAPINDGEEISLCISPYADSVGDVTARRKVLRDSFFFDCACDRCTREEATPTPSFVIEGDAAAKATALEASSDPTARLVYAPLARCLESEANETCGAARRRHRAREPPPRSRPGVRRGVGRPEDMQ